MKLFRQEWQADGRVAAGGMVLMVLLSVWGCGSGPQDGGKTLAASVHATGLPAGLFVDQVMDGARGILDAKKDFKPGESIVIRGRIGGAQPFAKGRAALTLYDLRLPACNENPDDACPKPWDFCCETRETRVSHAVSVQVQGEDGKVLAADLEGVRDLAPLDVLVVKGTVDKSSEGQNLVINATSVFIEKRGNREISTKKK